MPNDYDNPNNSRLVVEDPCVWSPSEVDDKFSNLTVTNDVSLYLNNLNEIVGFSETGSGGDIKICEQNMYRDPTKPFTEYYTKVRKPNGVIKNIESEGGKRQLYMIPTRRYSRIKPRRTLKKNRSKKHTKKKQNNIRSRRKKYKK